MNIHPPFVLEDLLIPSFTFSIASHYSISNVSKEVGGYQSGPKWEALTQLQQFSIAFNIQYR